jgi:YggT family protein
MDDSLNTAALFLINTVFDLYLVVLGVRFILAWSGSDYFNPINQVISKLTHPIIKILGRIIPTYSQVEYSTLFLMILLQMAKMFLISILLSGFPDFFVLATHAINNTIRLLLNIFFYAIFLQAILTWVQPGPSPLAQVLAQLTAPILRPLQRFIPPMGGMDLTAIPALIILQLLLILL